MKLVKVPDGLQVEESSCRRGSLPTDLDTVRSTLAQQSFNKNNNSRLHVHASNKLGKQTSLHSRPPSLCRGNLRASSFGGVGSDGQPTTDTNNFGVKYGLRRGSAPGSRFANQSSLDLVTRYGHYVTKLMTSLLIFYSKFKLIQLNHANYGKFCGDRMRRKM